MLILELAVQGVRGFSPSARIPFKPGYTGLSSPTEIPAPLQGLFLSLLYPDGRGGDASFVAPGGKSARAGLSVQADDQQVWRIVRDLGGAGAMHLLNPQTNQYEVVTQDTSEIAQLVRARVRLPDRATYQALFTFAPSQLPSKHLKQAAPVASSPSRLAPAPARRTMSERDATEAKARIAHLEAELKVAEEVAEQQFRLDGIQGEVFSAEQRLKAYEALKAQVAAAREELKAAPTPTSLGLPDDIVQRVNRFKEDKKQHDNALRILEEERQRAGVSDIRAPIVAPLYSDRRFLAALGGGVLALIGGASLDGPGRYVALLGLVGFTVAALLAMRFIEELQFAAREGAKGDVFGNREKKLKDEFHMNAKVVEMALEKVSATTADEFATAMARREALVPELAQLELQLAEVEAEPETAGLSTDIAHLKAEFEELNDRITQSSGGYARDTREIKGELDSLKEAIAEHEAPPAPQMLARDSSPSGVLDTSPKFEDPMPPLMEFAREFFAADISTLWNVLRERTLQYFMALTDRRYLSVDLDRTGAATLLVKGRPTLATELPPRDLDLLYVSTRLTIIEKWSAQAPLPVLIEDSFANLFDPVKQPLFARMLKHVGTLTQVLHVTGLNQPTYAEVLQAV